MAGGLLNRTNAAFYSMFRAALPAIPGPVVEIGAGGDGIKAVIPDAVTCDREPFPGVDRVFDASALPFDDGSIRAFCLLNVLHHLPEPARFFAEAERCLAPGGRLIVIDPHGSIVGRVLYGALHHEPFDPSGDPWKTPAPTNQAASHIFFKRDRDIFDRRYPRLRITTCRAHTLLAYVLSGGRSFPALLPGAAFPIINAIDRTLALAQTIFPIFATTVIEKTAAPR